MTNHLTPPGENVDTPEIFGLPVHQAASSLSECLKPYQRDKTSLTDMAEELRQTLYVEEIFDECGSLDALLVTQSRVLDGVFNRVLVNALEKPRARQAIVDLIAMRAAPGSTLADPAKEDSAPYNGVNHTAIELALRTQLQCRNTIESLRKTQFIRQREDRQRRDLELREKRPKK
jgi:hypothetical protein